MYHCINLHDRWSAQQFPNHPRAVLAASSPRCSMMWAIPRSSSSSTRDPNPTARKSSARALGSLFLKKWRGSAAVPRIPTPPHGVHDTSQVQHHGVGSWILHVVSCFFRLPKKIQHGPLVLLSISDPCLADRLTLFLTGPAAWEHSTWAHSATLLDRTVRTVHAAAATSRGAARPGTEPIVQAASAEVSDVGTGCFLQSQTCFHGTTRLPYFECTLGGSDICSYSSPKQLFTNARCTKLEASTLEMIQLRNRLPSNSPNERPRKNLWGHVVCPCPSKSSTRTPWASTGCHSPELVSFDIFWPPLTQRVPMWVLNVARNLVMALKLILSAWNPHARLDLSLKTSSQEALEHLGNQTCA